MHKKKFSAKGRWLLEDQNRLIKVRKNQIYFIQYTDKAYELMDTDIAMKVRSELYVFRYPRWMG